MGEVEDSGRSGGGGEGGGLPPREESFSFAPPEREGEEVPEEGAEKGPAEGAEALPNLAVRLFQVFTAPGELFERLRRRPAWAGALLLVVLLGVAGSLLLPENLLRQMAERRAPAGATAEELERALGFMRIAATAGAVVATPLVAALLAGLLILIYNVFLGGEATYRQLFSVTVHALLILSVGSLVTVALMVARGDIDVALSLHLLAPGADQESWAYSFLHGLNVFGLWTAAVLGIGVSRIYPRRSAGSSATLLLGLYVVFKGLAAFVPALSGS